MAQHELWQPVRTKLPGGAGVGLRVAVAALLLAVIMPCAAVAQTRPSQYDVEAAYLLNFGKFMHLSGASHALRHTSTFDICILGGDSIGSALERLAANNPVDGRTVRVVRDSTATKARTCAIAYISTHDDDVIRQDLNVLSGADVLTVGDAPEFLQDGGMIQFVIQKDHVRFAVNLNAVRRTHLELSSQLMQVALYVKGAPQPEGAP